MSAGGSVGVVNVGVVGTGIANTNAIFAQNNAYKVTTITPVSTVGKHKAFVYVKLNVTDLRSVPTLNVIPFFLNQVTDEYHQGIIQTVPILTAVGKGFEQVFEVELDGTEGTMILVDSISGQGASATIHIELL